MQTFSPRSFALYIVGRGIIGLGQGVALPAGATYLSEMAPTKIRGRALSTFQVFYSVGRCVVDNQLVLQFVINVCFCAALSGQLSIWLQSNASTR
jgi:MFS family permease